MKSTGRVAVVTGAGSGIGEATARRFAADGFHVVVGDINEAAAVKVAASLPGCHGMKMDVTVEAEVAAAVDSAVERYGRLDLMVNNAGVVGATGSIAQTTEDNWNRTVAILLNGVFFGVKHAARVMIPQKSGVILSVASVAGLRGGFGTHGYTACKHAVIGLTRSAASELAAHQIRVNAVAPGGTLTPLVISLRGSEEAAVAGQVAMSPLASVIMPEEIAGVLAFLASDAAAHITGQTLPVDSGRMAFQYPAVVTHDRPAGFEAGLAPKT